MLTVTLEDVIAAPPMRVLTKLSALIFVNLVLVAAIGIIDLYFVGRLGVDALTAFGFVISASTLLYGLAGSFGTGIRTAVAGRVGQGDAQGAGLTVTACCIATLPAFAALGTAGVLFDGPTFVALGASRDVALLAEAYMLPIWCSAPIVAISFIQSSALHAVGATQLALKLSLVPVALNAALAPLLMFGYGALPALGIFGTGLASAIAWTVSVAITAVVLTKRKLMAWRDLEPQRCRTLLAPVLEVALPSTFGRVVHPLSIAVLTAVVAALGPAAVAAFAIINRLSQLVVMGANAVGASIHIVAATARGAQNEERVRESIGCGALLGFIWGAAFSLLLAVLATPVASLFSKDQTIVSMTATHLRLGCGGLAFLCGGMALGASFNAIAHSKQGLVLGLLTTWLIQLPVAYLSARALHWTGFSAALTLAQAAMVVVPIVALRRLGFIALPRTLRPSPT